MRGNIGFRSKVYRSSPKAKPGITSEVTSAELVPIMGNLIHYLVAYSLRCLLAGTHLDGGGMLGPLYTNGPAALYQLDEHILSKSFTNHWAVVIPWYTWYDFGRVQTSLRCTAAMEAKIPDHFWSVRGLLEAA